MKTTDNAVVKKTKQNETKQKQEKKRPARVPLLLHFSWSAFIEDTGHELVCHYVRH